MVVMKPQTTEQKIRRTFTLTAESFAFVKESHQRLGAASNSEALESLLREAMRQGKLREIDAAYKEYYDAASDQDLAEQLEWAENTGPNMMNLAPEN
jgi:hypothetical protein